MQEIINMIKKNWLFFAILIILYFLTRFPYLLFHDVVYTYDQGRDFLKTAEVFLYKNPTFIGPTTGIMGLYHGAWWYYILGIPFLLTKGNPIAFYYFIFLITFFTNLLFFYVSKKIFNEKIALFLFFLITFSPYFIGKSFFVGNTTLVLPFLVSFIFANFLILEKNRKDDKFIFILGLSLGFIFEFEFGFGFLLTPLYFLLILLIKDLRKIFLKFKNFFSLIFGILIPIIPRLLFEFKNGFIQTKTLINYLIKPHYFNPKPFYQVFNDRLLTFIDYAKSIFNHPLIAFIFYFFVFKNFCLIFNKENLIYKRAYSFFILLFFGLFVFANFYGDNFWRYYYEGIEYLILFIIALSFYQKKENPLVNKIINLTIMASFFVFITNFSIKPNVERSTGLITHERVVNFILENEKNLNNYCVVVYTPPVIPYTYDYLFLYQEINGRGKKPVNNWVNNQCWYIIEKDDIKIRRENWIKNNLPKNAKIVTQKKFFGVEVIKLEI